MFAGVVLVQSLQLTGFFQYGVRLAAETENYFTSVERIQVYLLFHHFSSSRDNTFEMYAAAQLVR
jgi:hypothetical protein